MIHPVACVSSTDSGGGSGGSVSLNFNPTGGHFSTIQVSVSITVTGATRFKWRTGNGVWTTVEGNSGTVTAVASTDGTDLIASALDESGNVLATEVETYFKP